MTPDAFLNGDESEDSEDHLDPDTTLDEIPDAGGSNNTLDPVTQNEQH